ncbi:hypothetical protein F8M41_021235 [Gigaspora margarita]|uniref:Uncharacterized protein n=1 Tax=Gigaspora margarita TaxID=4874 RepID=A0A8H4AH37_GIGMA|nr:hypothetical protein F8M41_021235 [Gigaspora margarita]
MIITRKNRIISVDASYKNILETSLNPKGNLIEIKEKSQTKEKEELDQKTHLQKTVDEIDAEKDIPKELIESVKAELNRANTMGLNSQNTEVDNISNFQLKNQKADSAKKVESKIDSPDKDKYSKIDIVKEDILNIIWNLKPIEDNRTDVQYDSKISCQNKLDLVKNTQSTKDIKDVKKDKHEAFESYEKSTEPNERTRVKDRLKIFSYCQEYTEMKHVDETIEGYFKNRTSIEADIGPNSTNNLEHTCED